MIELGKRLVYLRKKHGLTQQQVADRIWVNKASISSYELSTRTPSYEVLIKLAELYGVRTDYLLGRDNENVIDISGLTDRQVSIIYNLIEEFKNNNK